jgi:hypothetical protein
MGHAQIIPTAQPLQVRVLFPVTNRRSASTTSPDQVRPPPFLFSLVVVGTDASDVSFIVSICLIQLCAVCCLFD